MLPLLVYHKAKPLIVFIMFSIFTNNTKAMNLNYNAVSLSQENMLIINQPSAPAIRLTIDPIKGAQEQKVVQEHAFSKEDLGISETSDILSIFKHPQRNLILITTTKGIHLYQTDGKTLSQFHVISTAVKAKWKIFAFHMPMVNYCAIKYIRFIPDSPLFMASGNCLGVFRINIDDLPQSLDQAPAHLIRLNQLYNQKSMFFWNKNHFFGLDTFDQKNDLVLTENYYRADSFKVDTFKEADIQKNKVANRVLMQSSRGNELIELTQNLTLDFSNTDEPNGPPTMLTIKNEAPIEINQLHKIIKIPFTDFIILHREKVGEFILVDTGKLTFQILTEQGNPQFSLVQDSDYFMLSYLDKDTNKLVSTKLYSWSKWTRGPNAICSLGCQECLKTSTCLPDKCLAGFKFQTNLQRCVSEKQAELDEKVQFLNLGDMEGERVYKSALVVKEYSAFSGVFKVYTVLMYIVIYLTIALMVVFIYASVSKKRADLLGRSNFNPGE